MKPFKSRSFKSSLAFYRTRHRTPGCKLTHMFGVPLLLAAPAVFLISRKAGFCVTFTGLALQMIGHSVFEKNEPTVWETKDPMAVPAAAVFTAEEWLDVVTGQWIKKNGWNLWEKRPVSRGVLSESYLHPVR